MFLLDKGNRYCYDKKTERTLFFEDLAEKEVHYAKSLFIDC